MDGDTIYVTNQPAIVAHAKNCQKQFPTIKNNIPKDTTRYKNTALDLSYIDNKLMSSQMGIGLSSNLAQIALSYSYTFPDKKYQNYVSILSVLAQIYIDSSKRAYDIDLNEETKRIQRDLNIKNNGYPIFFKPIQKYNNKRNGMGSLNISADKYNKSIRCPMNVLYNMNINPPLSNRLTPISMDKFFIPHPLEVPDIRGRKIEQLIEKYSFKLGRYQQTLNDDSLDDILLLRTDFDQLIQDIRQLHLGKKYQGLMSYLINRGFYITPKVKQRKKYMESKTHANRSVLVKTLYTLNPEQFLQCFIHNP